MNQFVNAVRQIPDSVTENGAATFSSSLDTHVDLFFRVGASRGKVHEVVQLFKKAFIENADLAIRIALWARDVRGGAGERDIFREMLKVMPRDVQIILLEKIVEVGRWDDLSELVLLSDSVVAGFAAEYWKNAVLSGHGLAAKWAPRKGPVAVKLRSLWKMSPKQYRKTIVSATNVVETAMCAKTWDEINFAHVPSVAAARYNAAFVRNAAEKYNEYKQSLVKGETKINAAAIFPHDVIRAAKGDSDHDIIDAQWNTLPNYLGEKSTDILIMSDVSGSMCKPVSGSVTALDISIALGLYVSERQVGPFKNLVLTFTSEPMFHHVQGHNIVERIRDLGAAAWGMSTDIGKAFECILKTAKDNRVQAEDMPKILLVLSDMEFDVATKNTTHFKNLQHLYNEAGYELPRVVFWNLNSRTKNAPVRCDQNGTALISGFSPSIMKSILSAEEFTPMSIMLKTVMVDRYTVNLD